MKDLYTFDTTKEEAKKSYDLVTIAYHNFFRELGLPFVWVLAQSGAMGGEISHEYQLRSPNGEDEIVRCTSCRYALNVEESLRILLRRMPSEERVWFPSCPGGRSLSSPTWDETSLGLQNYHSEPFLSSDGMTLVVAVTLKGNQSRGFNMTPISKLVPLDTSITNPYSVFKQRVEQCAEKDLKFYSVRLITDWNIPCTGAQWKFWAYNRSESYGRYLEVPTDVWGSPFSLTQVLTGDDCGSQQCQRAGHQGTLVRERSIELAHTFNLGTRYSKALHATVAPPSAGSKGGESKVDVQMGCHGVGLSRMIGAVADTYRDQHGLRWPRLMAPFEAIIIRRRDSATAADEIYDSLAYGTESIDCVIDDRDRDVGERFKEAMAIGYPLVIDVAKNWEQHRMCKVFFRRRDQGHVPAQVPFDKLKEFAVSFLK